jgi:hypothetical protein
MKITNLKRKFGMLILGTVISAAGFYGCGSTPVTTTQVNNLGFSSTSSVDSIGDAQNYFVLDTVKILIKDIKLNVANSNEDSTNFKVGPFVLFLNLGSSVNNITTEMIPAGAYDKIKFEVHKLEDAEAVPDPEFADANGRYSVIVKGSYYGNYFVYKSSKSAHQKLSFPLPVTLTTAIYSNITMIVRPYIWFVKNGVYLDPRDPANSNDIDNMIKDNINQNFKAFKDNDMNGLPD